MKITAVELVGKTIEDNCLLSFNDPSSSNPYQVKFISGLDASDLRHKFYGYGADGQAFFNVSLESKEVVFLLRLNPDFSSGKSYSSLRDDTYRAISSNRSGLLNINFWGDSGVVATLSGFVTKLEASHFTESPEIQITVNCEDPMLISPEETVLEFSETNSSVMILDEASTSPHGAEFEFEVVAPTVTTLEIGSIDDNWSFKVDYSFPDNSRIFVNSNYLQKEIYVVGVETTTHIADAIANGSVWPIIFPGENYFKLSSGVRLNRVVYRNTYWGI